MSCRVPLCTFILVALFAPVLIFAQKTSVLQRSLEQIAGSHNGKVALYAENLKSGEKALIHADEVVPTASTIKLAAFVEAFYQIKAGKRALGDPIALKAEDKVPGSGVLQYLRAPLQLSLEDVLVLMMIESDNTATNLVIDQLGLPAINARLSTMGLKNTYLYKKVYKPAEGVVPADQKRYGLGKTTARELATLMKSVVSCELKDEALCKKMVDILKGQQHRDLIPPIHRARTRRLRGGHAHHQQDRLSRHLSRRCRRHPRQQRPACHGHHYPREQGPALDRR